MEWKGQTAGESAGASQAAVAKVEARAVAAEAAVAKAESRAEAAEAKANASGCQCLIS